MVTVYHDADADMAALDGKCVAVIGYGNQGHAQAQNLRDSGATVIVGNRQDEYRKSALADDFEVLPIRDAARRGDIVLMLIPDEVQPQVFARQVLSGLAEGDTLVFASGYNVAYGLVQGPECVDVVMVAPRMIGSAVRNLYRQGKGYPCLVAVGQNATGQALATALAVARGIGATRAAAFASSFEEEALMDLFAEQFLWAGIVRLCTLYYDMLVEAGCAPESVASELYLSGEMVEVAEAMIETGFFKQLDLHSHTSQYGQLSRGERVVGDGAQRVAAEIMEQIRSGQFAQEWTAEQQAGMPHLEGLKKTALTHPLNEVEQRTKRILGLG